MKTWKLSELSFIFAIIYCTNFLSLCASDPAIANAVEKECVVVRAIKDLDGLWNKLAEERGWMPTPEANASIEVAYHSNVMALLEIFVEELGDGGCAEPFFSRLDAWLVEKFIFHMTNSAFLQLFASQKIGCWQLDSPVNVDMNVVKHLIDWLWQLISKSRLIAEISKRTKYATVCKGSQQVHVAEDVLRQEQSSSKKKKRKKKGKRREQNVKAGTASTVRVETISLAEIIVVLRAAVALIDGDLEGAITRATEPIFELYPEGEGSLSATAIFSLAYVKNTACRALQADSEPLTANIISSWVENGPDLASIMTLAGAIALKIGDWNFVKYLIPDLSFSVYSEGVLGFFDAIFVEDAITWMLVNIGDTADTLCEELTAELHTIASAVKGVADGFVQRAVCFVRIGGAFLNGGLISYIRRELVHFYRVGTDANVSDKICHFLDVLCGENLQGQSVQCSYDERLASIIACIDTFPKGSVLSVLALNVFVKLAITLLENGGSCSFDSRSKAHRLICDFFDEDNELLKYVFRKAQLLRVSGLLLSNGVDWPGILRKSAMIANSVVVPSIKLLLKASLFLALCIDSCQRKHDFEEILELARHLEKQGEGAVAALILGELACQLRTIGKVGKSIVLYDRAINLLDSFAAKQNGDFVGFRQSNEVAQAITALVEYNLENKRLNQLKGLDNLLFANIKKDLALAELIETQFLAKLLYERLNMIVGKGSKKIFAELKEMISTDSDLLDVFLEQGVLPAGVSASEAQVLKEEISCCYSDARKIGGSSSGRCSNGRRGRRRKGGGSLKAAQSLNVESFVDEMEDAEDSEEDAIDIPLEEFVARLDFTGSASWCVSNEEKAGCANLVSSSHKPRPYESGSMVCVYPGFESECKQLEEYWAAKESGIDIDISHIFDLMHERENLFDGGFHHDPENILKIESDPSIPYTASFYFYTKDGDVCRDKPSSFFPRSWSRKKVLDVIYRVVMGVKRRLVSLLDKQKSALPVSLVYRDSESGLSIKIVAKRPANKNPFIRSAYPVGLVGSA